jgi:putative nucleotidyltransferase with HDIG domain
MKIDDEILPLSKDLLEALEQCPQSPKYHAEGNVLNHTKLVLRMFQENQDLFYLSEEDKTILYWASMLHDIGKPLVTEWKENRWSAQGHEMAGVHIARNFLLSRPEISHEVRRKILDIVRWHFVPFRFMKQNRPDSDFMKMYFMSDLRLIGVFSVFDFFGRVCIDKEDSVKRIHTFVDEKLPFLESVFGSWQEINHLFHNWNPKQKNVFYSAVDTGRFDFVEKLLKKEYKEESDFVSKVTLIVGLPESGKTQFLNTHFGKITRIDLKDFDLDIAQEQHTHFYIQRRLVEFKYHLKVMVKHYPELIIDGNNTNLEIRKGITEILKGLGCEVEALVLEPFQNYRVLYGLNPISDSEKEYRNFMYPHPFEFHTMRFGVLTPKAGIG